MSLTKPCEKLTSLSRAPDQYRPVEFFVMIEVLCILVVPRGSQCGL